MIFLIAKIFVYLLLSGVVGAAAGWLTRNLQAQRSEENASRAVNDAKSKVPQLESLLRGRDEQVTKLKAQVNDGRGKLNDADEALRASEQSLRDQQREAKRWQQSAEAASAGESEGFDITADDSQPEDGDSNSLIAELSQEITRLKAQIEQAGSAPVVTGDSGDDVLLQVEMETLRAQFTKAENALQIAVSELALEQTKVGELERERELQNKSLQVLHQQLDLERTRRVAAG
jgi:hypothetical protein